MFHGCGVDDNGEGFLFLGASGQGKSTMAWLWKKQGITLSDERVIVREVDGQLLLFGTPWHSSHPEVANISVPLKKIFFLNHGPHNRVERKSAIEASAGLFSRSYPTHWDKQCLSNTLAFCEKLISQVPCYDLYFVPDREVVDFVRCVN